MTDRNMFDKLKYVYKLLWKDDDLMEQLTLFELQEKVGMFLVEFADGNKMFAKELVKEFPWVFLKIYK